MEPGADGNSLDSEGPPGRPLLPTRARQVGARWVNRASPPRASPAAPEFGPHSRT